MNELTVDDSRVGDRKNECKNSNHDNDPNVNVHIHKLQALQVSSANFFVWTFRLLRSWQM